MREFIRGRVRLGKSHRRATSGWHPEQPTINAAVHEDVVKSGIYPTKAHKMATPSRRYAAVGRVRLLPGKSGTGNNQQEPSRRRMRNGSRLS
jgi:hypothetical protein